MKRVLIGLLLLSVVFTNAYADPSPEVRQLMNTEVSMWDFMLYKADNRVADLLESYRDKEQLTALMDLGMGERFSDDKIAALAGAVWFGMDLDYSWSDNTITHFLSIGTQQPFTEEDCYAFCEFHKKMVMLRLGTVGFRTGWRTDDFDESKIVKHLIKRIVVKVSVSTAGTFVIDQNGSRFKVDM